MGSAWNGAPQTGKGKADRTDGARRKKCKIQDQMDPEKE
jgi:hypothetical protein